MRCKTDYCDTCCKFHIELMSKSTSEEEKQIIKMNLKSHLELANNARSLYLDHCLQTDSVAFTVSFDYSENIVVPHLIETPSVFFFKTRRKNLQSTQRNPESIES